MSDDGERDDVLLEAWGAGDMDAGDELIKRNHKRLYNFVRSKLDRRAEIEEVIQQTYVQLLRSRSRYRGRGKFRAYLFGIARNVLLHHLRTRNRDRLVLEETSVEDLEPGPFEWCASRWETIVLVRALRRIPIDLQILLELHFWEELSVRELCDVYDAPRSTVRNRIKAAQERLRKKIDECTHEPEQTRFTLMGMATWADEVRRMEQWPTWCGCRSRGIRSRDESSESSCSGR